MQLSIVIVNYNVEFFLEQCLNSVFAATKHIEAEVFVVDNNSIDGSVKMIKDRFPDVILIENKDNSGFSKANNQALKIAKGKYHLLLNPDTVVEEDTFTKCLDFMESHPDCGGLGVNMIDGKGNFLPESKRGLPTPKVAFFKIFGLSRLFPKSRTFGQYHLTYLDREKTHEIDVLSGAYMLMRKETLDKVGLLDESFFMYGEDIDLSYRIQLGGYKNYYFPEARIIHYKGESTKKSSVNYVFVFYRAMIIFARKHFGGSKAKLFSFLINLAIYFRAGIAIFWRILKRLFLPLVDAVFTGTILYAIGVWYQGFSDKIFPSKVFVNGIIAYAVIWIIAFVLTGVYDKPAKLIKNIGGSFLGLGLILILYALLPKEYQFSRLFILLGGLAVLIYQLISRVILHSAVGGGFRIGGEKNKRFAIIGSKKEVERVNLLLEQTNSNIQKVFFVDTEDSSDEGFIGNLSQLDQVVDIHKVDELIFCAKDVAGKEIINLMMRFTDRNLDFKIAQPETAFLIGSNSIDTKGDLYVMDINKIDKPSNRRNKRILDCVLSFSFLILSPLLIWFYKHKINWFANMSNILFGKKTFVGYHFIEHSSSLVLPKIKKGVLPISLQVKDGNLDEETIGRMNLIYAKNQTMLTDIVIIFRNFLSLDK